MLHLPDGRIFRQFGYHWLGIINTQPNEGEEGGCTGDDKCRRTNRYVPNSLEHISWLTMDRLYLRCVSVARLRFSTFWYWFWSFRGLRFVFDRVCVGNSMDAHQGEPKTTRFDQRAGQLVRILVCDAVLLHYWTNRRYMPSSCEMI
jgi:hypothetical protein